MAYSKIKSYDNTVPALGISKSIQFGISEILEKTNYITFSYNNTEYSITSHSYNHCPISSPTCRLSVRCQQLRWSLLLGLPPFLDDVLMKQYLLYVTWLFQNHISSSYLLSSCKIFLNIHFYSTKALLQKIFYYWKNRHFTSDYDGIISTGITLHRSTNMQLKKNIWSNWF